MNTPTDWRKPVGVTFDQDTLDELTRRAEEIGISRSALIRILIKQALKQPTDAATLLVA